MPACVHLQQTSDGLPPPGQTGLLSPQYLPKFSGFDPRPGALNSPGPWQSESWSEQAQYLLIRDWVSPGRPCQGEVGHQFAVQALDQPAPLPAGIEVCECRERFVVRGQVIERSTSTARSKAVGPPVRPNSRPDSRGDRHLELPWAGNPAPGSALINNQAFTGEALSRTPNLLQACVSRKTVGPLPILVQVVRLARRRRCGQRGM